MISLPGIGLGFESHARILPCEGVAAQWRDVHSGAQCLLHEKLFRNAAPVSCPEAKVAHETQGREVIAEEAVEGLHALARHLVVAASGTLIAAQYRPRVPGLAGLVRGKNDLCEDGCIAEAEIDPLAGKRVDLVCGIASENKAFCKITAGMLGA